MIRVVTYNCDHSLNPSFMTNVNEFLDPSWDQMLIHEKEGGRDVSRRVRKRAED